MMQDTILLVDDDIDQLSILGAMLSKFPQNIITALSGARALEILKSDVPQLVITDMVMPDIGGSDILKFIRSETRLKHTKVVLVSSLMKYITDDDKAKADKVMIKPIKKSDIEAVVRELLPMRTDIEQAKPEPPKTELPKIEQPKVD
jgi:DNA-binding NtrC family response regulator